MFKMNLKSKRSNLTVDSIEKLRSIFKTILIQELLNCIEILLSD